MATLDLECPICSAEIPLSGDEQKGDEVVCVYCSSPLRLTSDIKLGEEAEVEEDF